MDAGEKDNSEKSAEILHLFGVFPVCKQNGPMLTVELHFSFLSSPHECHQNLVQ